MLEGVNLSINKVISFGPIDASADLSFAPTTIDVEAHEALIDAAFDSDPEGGWNVLGREFFTALYGNGIEGYNFYRRTKFPSNLQPNIEPNPGDFINSFFYPANFVNNNSSVPQKSGVTSKVFWDKNTENGGDVSSN